MTSQDVLNELTAWAADPSQLEDDGCEPPTAEAFAAAIRFAETLRSAGEEAPLRVVSDGDGGITFECLSPPWFDAYEVDELGTIEHVRSVRATSRVLWRGQIFFC